MDDDFVRATCIEDSYNLVMDFALNLVCIYMLKVCYHKLFVLELEATK